MEQQGRVGTKYNFPLKFQQLVKMTNKSNNNNNIRTFSQTKCCLCGTKGSSLYRGLRDFLFGVPGEWNLRKCSNPECELLWLDPMPIAEDIPKLYSSYYTHTHANNLPAWLIRIVKNIEASIWASAFEYEVGSQAPVFKGLGWALSRSRSLRERTARMVMWLKASQRGGLLDVGCGSGLFMREMRDLGWDVTGIEPDYRAACIAREDFGLDVYQSSIEEAGFADCTFDAITMNNVLEHLFDPLRTLAECRRILKSKGRLVILTPNATSIGHRYFKRDWRGLEPPRHFFLFNPQNIRHAIEYAGLCVEYMGTVLQGAGSILARSHELRHFRLLEGCVRDSYVRCLGEQSRPLIKCILYQLWESLSIIANPQIGEEILAIATKQ